VNRPKIARWLCGIAVIATSLLILILAVPHLVSDYYVEAGGRVLQDAEQLAYNPLPALAHLQKAIEWAPDNAQAYRLLGRVHRAQGDWPAAIAALARYTELRPADPLGHLALAEAYETVEAAMAVMYLVDLIAALPGATVQAPESPVDTPYARPEGPAWHSYVAATAFSLPPNFGERPALFMHTPSRVSATLSLPAQPATLRFGMGMDPRTDGWPGDGVTFEVFVDGERIFLEHVDKTAARQGWHERAIDLAPWAGQEVDLALAVTPGPVGDAGGDWAGWGEPQVVDARLPALEALHAGTRLLDEWKRGGLTSADFIARGEEARESKQYAEALAWYERAIRLEPAWGDPWYFVGLLYEDQQQWLQALEAYERAIDSDALCQVTRSSPHYRAGLIYHRRLDPRQPEHALPAYEAALAADDFSSPAEAADCHYGRGQILRGQKADPGEYVAEFRRAIALNPRHTWAHILLGLAVYERDKDASTAENELLTALDLAPKNKWTYYHLGEIYRQEGRTSEATVMYEGALALDPDFEAAQKRLVALRKRECE